MPMEEEIKKGLLDKLMSEMDEYMAKGSEKPKAVAVIEEKQVIPAEKAPEVIKKKMSDAPVYLNPSRQSVLDEVEDQSAGGDKHAMIPSELPGDGMEEESVKPKFLGRYYKSLKRG